ncbi:MAG: hypothetical protein H0T79_05475, partial [Deltaproteobacteria bacterium]|nr:hypothetical protein [Deltaproteobacteria bacterium]
AIWVEPRAKRIATGLLPIETVELALAVGLPQLAARNRRRELLVETIDGTAAADSPLARTLVSNGARLDYRGLVVRGIARPLAPEPPPDDAEADPDELDPPDALDDTGN